MEIVKIQSNAHWYQQDGTPEYEATLREARKRNLLPSITTVLQDLPKPGLQAWKDEQLILSSLTLPRIEGETDIEFCKRVVLDSKEQGKKAAEKGTDIHDRIEQYITEKGHSLDGYPTIREWVDENIHNVFFSEDPMACISHGFAGRMDALVESKGKTMLIDFKTQGTKAGKKINIYPEWCYQLAAGEMLFEKYKEVKIDILMNLVISTTEDRIEEVFWPKESIEKGREVFLTALKLFRLTRNFEYVRNN